MKEPQGDEIDKADVVARRADVVFKRPLIAERVHLVNALQHLDSKRPDTDSILERLEHKVKKATAALVDTYGKYGAQPKDFGLVTYEDVSGRPVHVVMSVGACGIDLSLDRNKSGLPIQFDPNRSWAGIMRGNERNNELHTVTVEGIKYDGRAAMTQQTYRAFVETEKAAGRKLPDRDIKGDDPAGSTITFLTGEVAPDDWHAPIACVDSEGDVAISTILARAGFRSAGFRPGLVLPAESV